MSESKQQRLEMPTLIGEKRCREQDNKTLLFTRKHIDIYIEHWKEHRVDLGKEFDVDKAIETLEENKKTISMILDERYAL